MHFIWDDENVLHHLFEYQTHKQIGIGIQVCKKWKQFVDVHLPCFYQILSFQTLNENLIHFCEKGDWKVVYYLISKGADIYYEDYFLLKSACSQGYLPMVQFLVSKEPLYTHKCVLPKVSVLNRTSKIQSYIPFKGENVQDNCCMYMVCINGHLHILVYFVSLGVNIHVEDDYYFYLACENGHAEMVQYFVSQGSNVHTSNKALESAICGKRLNVVQYLVSQNVNIRFDDDYPLQLASENGDVEMVKYLISLGAQNLDNALWFSCIHNQISVATYLIQQGANVNIFTTGDIKTLINGQKFAIVSLIFDTANEQFYSQP